jgi:hypothetical protein
MSVIKIAVFAFIKNPQRSLEASVMRDRVESRETINASHKMSTPMGLNIFEQGPNLIS